MKNNVQQYILAFKTLSGVDELVKMLKKDGFIIHHGLDEVYTLKEKIIGICIDLNDKVVFQINVTGMACWCQGRRKPLYPEEIIEHYQQLITENNYKLFNYLVRLKSQEPDRPIGFLYRCVEFNNKEAAND